MNTRYGFQLFATMILLVVNYPAAPLRAQTVVNRFMGKGVRYTDMSPAVRAMPPGFTLTGNEKTNSLSAVKARDHNGILYACTHYESPDSVSLLYTGYRKKSPHILLQKQIAVPDSLAKKGLNLCITDNRKTPNTLFLFSRDGILRRSILNGSDLSTWSDFAVMNGYRGDRIASVFQNRDGELYAFFSDCEPDNDRAGKCPIYKIKSSDNGISWSLPEIAVKHNLYNLTYASVARCEKKGKAGLYMIITETGRPSVFLSVSKDEGKTWSYPILLPGFLAGSGHQIAIYDDTVYILYEDNIKKIDEKFINNIYGSLMIWKGSVKDLTGRNRGDGIFRIAEPSRGTSFPGSTEAVMIPLSKDRINLTLGSKWIRPEESISLKSYDIRIDDN